jgi:hypothetical protein
VREFQRGEAISHKQPFNAGGKSGYTPTRLLLFGQGRVRLPGSPQRPCLTKVNNPGISNDEAHLGRNPSLKRLRFFPDRVIFLPGRVAFSPADNRPEYDHRH